MNNQKYKIPGKNVNSTFKIRLIKKKDTINIKTSLLFFFKIIFIYDFSLFIKRG